MSNQSDLLRLAASISATQLGDFATSRGWQRSSVASKRPIRVLEHSEHPARQLLIPKNVEADDFAERVADVVRTLAETSQDDALHVIEQVIAFSSDILRFAVSSPETERGVIPLADGIELLAGAKQALLAAAHSVLQPQHHHPRLGRSDAESFVQECELGQTERGSFVVSILCPLQLGSLGPGLFQEESCAPFGRKATHLLMSSLQTVVRAAEEDEWEQLSSERSLGDAPVISSNLCDALLQMKADGNRGSLSVAASWSARWRAPSVPRQVRIANEHFAGIEALSTRLRPKPAVEEKQTCAAHVTTLNGDPNADGEVSGEVTFLMLMDDGTVRARGLLGVVDYQVAIQAHERNQKVSFDALVRQEGPRSFRVEEIAGFRLL